MAAFRQDVSQSPRQMIDLLYSGFKIIIALFAESVCMRARDNLLVTLLEFSKRGAPITEEKLILVQSNLKQKGLDAYPLQERLTGLRSDQLVADLEDLELYKVVDRKSPMRLTEEGKKYLEDYVQRNYTDSQLARILEVLSTFLSQ